MRTKKEVIDFLESLVGGGVKCKGDPSLDSQCVTLIKSLMEFIGAPDPYKKRGHAKTCISAYLSEGIADKGVGFLSVFSNKDMGGGYGHIWCNAGDGDGVFYESNGQKALTVTKGKTYSYDTVCNFDRYITTVQSTQENMAEKTITIPVAERDNFVERSSRLDGFEVAGYKKVDDVKLAIQTYEDRIKSLKKGFDEFLREMVTILDPNTVIEIADQDLVKNLSKQVVADFSKVQTELSRKEKLWEKTERELEAENRELEKQLIELKAELEEVKRQHVQEIERLQKRVETVKTTNDEIQKKRAENKSLLKWVNRLKKFLLQGIKE